MNSDYDLLIDTGLDRPYIQSIINNALEEDVGSGDVTTEACISRHTEVTARLVSRQEGVLAGGIIAAMVFRALDESILWEIIVDEGDRLTHGDEIGCFRGSVSTLLTGERVALNLIQRMSGIATETARYIAEVAGTGVTILDTRKTMPGLRKLDKYAVRIGGGTNHRSGLFDAVLVKDNHIRAAGGLNNAVNNILQTRNEELSIQVECDTLEQLEECIILGVDLVLLDNMDANDLRKAVELSDGRARLEASGGITLENVREIAETGIDFISVGAITHSVTALDIGLDFD